MALLDSIIIASCVSASGAYHDACVKSLEAGSQQSGMYKQMHQYEKRQTKAAQYTARELLGKDTVDVVGGTVWIGRSIAEKKASVNLPNFGLCHKMSAEIGDKESKLVLKWSF